MFVLSSFLLVFVTLIKIALVMLGTGLVLCFFCVIWLHALYSLFVGKQGNFLANAT